MMQESVSVKKGTFASPLLPVITVLFALTALVGAAAVASLFHSASIPAILADMETAQVNDPNARLSWLIIYIVVTAFNCVAALIMFLGLLQVLTGRHYRGMDLLYNSAKILLLLVNVSGVICFAYFILRAALYTVSCLSVNGGVVPLYAMVLMEGMMIAQAIFLFFKSRQFLGCLMDAVAGIGYTLSSGQLKAPTIPAFSATGFLFLAIFNIGIALDRLFTFIHIQINLSVIYRLPMTHDPVQILSGLSFILGAAACILMFVYLRRYKYKSEQLLFCTVKEAVES